MLGYDVIIYTEAGTKLVTLIVTVNGPESIWLLADRRLSFDGSRKPRDDAIKILALETTDGVALLGYAGLGLTARETEPSDWMSGVLRGRNFPMEQSLRVLAKAAKAQLPRHMIQIPGKGWLSHNIVVTSFVCEKANFYTIDLSISPNRDKFPFRHTRHVSDIGKTPRLSVAGSGGALLASEFQAENKKWIRELLCIIRAHDRGQVSPHAVSDNLAKLNHEVHQSMVDQTVGPNCIVAWRNKKSGAHNGGGAHQFYTGTTRDKDNPSLPSIGCGIDISALAEITAPITIELFERLRSGESNSELDTGKLDTEVARLKTEPDEKLS